jgi:hypothetical protein
MPQPTSAGESGSASAEVTGDAGTSSIDESDVADDAPKFELGHPDQRMRPGWLIV